MRGLNIYLVALLTNPYCLAVAVIYPHQSGNIEGVDQYYAFARNNIHVLSMYKLIYNFYVLSVINWDSRSIAFPVQNVNHLLLPCSWTLC